MCCSDLHNQIQVINNRALPIISREEYSKYQRDVQVCHQDTISYLGHPIVPNHLKTSMVNPLCTLGHANPTVHPISLSTVGQIGFSW